MNLINHIFIQRCVIMTSLSLTGHVRMIKIKTRPTLSVNDLGFVTSQYFSAYIFVICYYFDMVFNILVKITHHQDHVIAVSQV